MRNPARTLYSQIAGLYLVLLLTFTTIAVFVVAQELQGFLSELEQRLNRDLAAHLVKELAPSLVVSAQNPEALAAIERIRSINPAIDLYLLGNDGRIIESFTGRMAARPRIDIAPIEQFLKKGAMLPIRAADPGVNAGDQVFSAAPILAAGEPGYLYVILRGMPFQTAASMMSSSYIVRGAGGVLLMVLLATAGAGLILFAVLTRRLRRLIVAVNKFREGAFDQRADAEPLDQIGRLAAAFNEMATRIEAQVEALKRTDQARRSLAANISHDFRTPLTSLRGYTERLLHADARMDLPQRRDCLAAVLRSASQLERLADQLASISRLDSPEDRALATEPFSMAELAQDAVAKFGPAAEKRGVALTVSGDQSLQRVSGDIALIERALSNLIDNAIDSTAANGAVSVSVSREADQVRIEVRDNGAGIAADELPLVAQRFYRTRASRLAGRSGSGLGLAIARDIVARHGGSLSIQSEEGVGTVVSFALPVAALSAATPG